MSDAPASLYTIGHSRHPAERFTALLVQHGIGRLVDVRSRPVSRWSPHFNKGALTALLEAQGIEYVFLGGALGGRPPAPLPEFRAGVERLVELARDRRTVILCAEEDPESCHRRLLVAPAVVLAGLAVLHIRGDGRLEPHPDPDPSAQLRLFRDPR